MGLSQSSYDEIKNRFLSKSIVTNAGKKGWSSLLADGESEVVYEKIHN